VPDKVTYYALVNDHSSRERPATVFRRTYTETGGKRDELFTRDLIWEFSPLLVSAERGDLQNEFIKINEDEANQIVERIRANATGSNREQQLSPRAQGLPNDPGPPPAQSAP
jgi:hypothetical protein